MENSMEFPQKTKNITTVWPSNFISRCISEENETLIQTDTWTPMFIAALFTIAKMEAT